MHRFMVNFNSLAIFNRVFETRKSAQNAKKFAKMRTIRTRDVRVNHPGINHAVPLTVFHLALTRRNCGPVHHRGAAQGMLQCRMKIAWWLKVLP
jgi:hypothetical protein